MKKAEQVLSKVELMNRFKDLWNQGHDLSSSKKYEDLSKGLNCFLEALSLRKEISNNQNHPNTAKVLYNIGYLYRQLGGVDNCLKALDFHQQALEMRRAYYGDKANAEIAESLNMIGTVYRALDGNINKLKSLELKNKALEMRQELYSDQAHSKIIESLLNVAIAYDDFGSDADLAKSLDLLKQALGMAKSLYGEQPHRDTANILYIMGINYQKLEGIDNLNKALANLQESLDIRQKLSSDIDPEVAAILNNIGILHQKLSFIDSENKQKHLECNLEYIKKAVDINQELYGSHPHPDLAKSIQGLSIAYIHLGDMKQAYQLQKRALEMYQKLYAADHPDVIGCLNNLNYINSNSDFKSYEDNNIVAENHSSDLQLLSTHIKNDEHFAPQDLDTEKDSTALMGNINIE